MGCQPTLDRLRPEGNDRESGAHDHHVEQPQFAPAQSDVGVRKGDEEDRQHHDDVRLRGRRRPVGPSERSRCENRYGEQAVGTAAGSLSPLLASQLAANVMPEYPTTKARSRLSRTVIALRLVSPREPGDVSGVRVALRDTVRTVEVLPLGGVSAEPSPAQSDFNRRRRVNCNRP